MRYIIPYSSIFNSMPYDIEKLKYLLKLWGSKNIRTKYSLGMNNQPRILSFSYDFDPKFLEKQLNIDFKTCWIIVEKDAK